MLQHASLTKRFRVIVTEALPSGSGRQAVSTLRSYGIDAALISDAAAGYMMQRENVDMVLVGADALCQVNSVLT